NVHPSYQIGTRDEYDLIKPQKLINPILASVQRRALHQELLFCHRRGMLPRKKSELQRVLESKNREQLKKTELSLQPRSDLEVKLRRRQQRIQHKWRESLKNVPEFVRSTKNRAEPEEEGDRISTGAE
uniref:Uncharacterized protein n=1 Tax=Poecilia latipinna TaxID=48699 RepID=A0A3B3V9B9_9TELE